MVAPTDQTPAFSAAFFSRHYLLFGIQTAGATILLWTGVPLYRGILADAASHKAQLGTLVWSLSAIVLMQMGYWLGRRLPPLRPIFTNALLGLVISFLARMVFVVASSIFGLVFITRSPGLQIPTLRYLVILVGLFSLFCYMKELERLGAALVGQRNE
jgi:hypothetical protein